MMYDVVNLCNSFNFSPFAIRHSFFCRKFAARFKESQREQAVPQQRNLFSAFSLLCPCNTNYQGVLVKVTG